MVAEIRAHLAKDPILRPLVETIPFPEPPEKRDVYEGLVRSIVSQQLSGKAAATIYSRFLHLFPEEYPSAERLAIMDTEPLRAAGLSNAKAQYVRNVAAFFLQEKPSREFWETHSEEYLIEYLTQIKGVGKWTVEMVLMFVLGKPDILPLDDLGVRQAMIALYNIKETGKDLIYRILELSEPWRPYRTFASRYLWQYKDMGK